MLAGTAAVSPVFGDQVMSIEGDYDSIRPASATFQSMATFTGPGSLGVAQFNPSTLVGLTVDELTVNFTSATMMSGTRVTGPVTVSSPLHVFGPGAEEAVFNLTNAQIDADNFTRTATVTADALYVSDTFGGMADLSLFSMGGPAQFVAQLTNIEVTVNVDLDEGQASWNAQPAPHAAFTLTAAVPEPASLLLFGPGLLGLIACTWRRRKSAA
jgi:hypothetical protein